MLAVQLTTPLRMHDTTGRHHMYRECLMNLQVWLAAAVTTVADHG